MYELPSELDQRLLRQESSPALLLELFLPDGCGSRAIRFRPDDWLLAQVLQSDLLYPHENWNTTPKDLCGQVLDQIRRIQMVETGAKDRCRESLTVDHHREGIQLRESSLVPINRKVRSGTKMLVRFRTSLEAHIHLKPTPRHANLNPRKPASHQKSPRYNFPIYGRACHRLSQPSS